MSKETNRILKIAKTIQRIQPTDKLDATIKSLEKIGDKATANHYEYNSLEDVLIEISTKNKIKRIDKTFYTLFILAQVTIISLFISLEC